MRKWLKFISFVDLNLKFTIILGKKVRFYFIWDPFGTRKKTIGTAVNSIYTLGN